MILVAALALMVVVALFGRAMVVLGPTSLALSSSMVEKGQARAAAESGLAYARAQLRRDPTWRGDQNRQVINTAELFVEEHNGNVIGLLTSPDGRKSQFRLRFNYQNGGGANDPDGLADSNFVVDNIFVSVNNLEGDVETTVPRADDGNWIVSQPGLGYKVPDRSAAVIVEGRAGPAVQALSPLNPNDTLSGARETYVAEEFLRVKAIKDLGESSLMAGGDIKLNIRENSGKKHFARVRSAKKQGVPRIRSKGSIGVEKSDGGMGDLRIKKSGRVSRNENLNGGTVQAYLPNGAIALDHEEVGDDLDFFNLKWSDVEKAGQKSPAIEMKAGTYVCWKDGTQHYYDMTLDEYADHIRTNPLDGGLPLDPHFTQVRKDSLGATSDVFRVSQYDNEDEDTLVDTYWHIKKDLEVVPSDLGVTDFNILPRSGAPFDSTDQKYVFSPPVGYGSKRVKLRPENVIISVPGNMTVMANFISSKSTVTVEGELKMSTPGNKVKGISDAEDDESDESDVDLGEPADEDGLPDEETTDGLGDLRINFYAKKDILLSTIDASGANPQYRNLNFKGLIYTWQDFKAITGEKGVGWGDFSLTGALVAYGSDPVTGKPGSQGQGEIDIQARRVKLTWDSRKVSDMIDIGTVSIELERTAFSTY
jgi:hypothetical protein